MRCRLVARHSVGGSASQRDVRGARAQRQTVGLRSPRHPGAGRRRLARSGVAGDAGPAM